MCGMPRWLTAQCAIFAQRAIVKTLIATRGELAQYPAVGSMLQHVAAGALPRFFVTASAAIALRHHSSFAIAGIVPGRLQGGGDGGSCTARVFPDEALVPARCCASASFCARRETRLKRFR